MKPTDSNPSQNYGGASYSSSSLAHPVGSIVTPSYLESPSIDMTPLADVTPVSSLPDLPTSTPNPHSQRFSVFRLNHTALLVTTLVISFIVLIGLSSFAFNKLTSKQSVNTPQNSNSPTSQYSVGNLPLQKLNSTTTQLQLGTADKLAINGQLLVNNTLVLNPTTTPSTPTAGQLYYDKTTNQPYFYNGAKFISLQPTTTSVTSTSPQTTSSTTTTLTPTVTSLGGSTGDITLGTGLSLTANQLDVATNLLNNLNATNITSGTLSNTRLNTNVTTQGNSFNGANQLVQLTSGGLLPALDGSNLTNLNLSGLNASNITSGTLADARLSTNVTIQGNAFNGTSQLVQTNVSGELPELSGTNLTSLNGTNITTGTVADARLSTNVALLNGSSPQIFSGNNSFSGLLTASSSATALAVTGTPTNTATSSLIQVGSPIASGNIALNGGTYLGLNAPSTGSGSTADFLNLQVNGSSKLLVANTGAITGSGTITVPTFASTVPTGTAPFTVASTTKVTNLNADLLDGLDSTAFGDATAANQTTILNRIGTNLDVAGTSTLFARLNNIDTNQGNLADAASTTGSVLARLASLFTLVGTPTDAASSSGTLFAQVRDVRANVGSKTRRIVTLLSGTSWTVPAGVTYVNATLIGGGGGGGDINASNLSGGDGHGGQIVRTMVAVTPGGSITYAIGAGGAGGGSYGSPGSPGGATSFTGATSASGGAGGAGGASGGAGGAGAAGLVSDNGGGLGINGSNGGAGGAGAIELEYWQ